MINELSDKQIEIFQSAYGNKYFDIIADGAVRSGKTLCCSVAFVMWAMDTFNERNFAICGKTVGSAIKNIILPLLALNDLKKVYRLDFRRSYNCLIVTFKKRTNYFYVYGGSDERSQDLIQGITLSGFLLDEVALMPQSFVNQAIARTLSVPNAKRFYNCNPENPNHYIYTDFILKAKEKNIKVIHFLMTDNPSLTKEQLEKAYSMFSGVFYKRFILGQWVRAEGVIYNKFAEDTDKYLIEDSNPLIRDIILANIGIDFGGNKSATAFICTGFTRGFKNVIILESERITGIIDPVELEERYSNFVNLCFNKYSKSMKVFCDSAEQVLIRGLHRKTQIDMLNATIYNALKTPILDRISLVNKLIGQGRFFVLKHCTSLIKAMQDAVWKEDTIKDERLDDGTSDIDSLDAMEYSIEPYSKNLIDYLMR